MNSWCESCARKNLCYVVDDRPKCFVPITNTASGTPYLVEISSISRDSHEIAKDETTERQRLEGKRWTDALTIEEKKQLLDGCWIVDEPQTETKKETENSNLAFELVNDSQGLVNEQTDCPWK